MDGSNVATLAQVISCSNVAPPTHVRQTLIIRVTRVWRNHLTEEELEIACSTLFDMRGNMFSDEMACSAAKRVEVFPRPAKRSPRDGW